MIRCNFVWFISILQFIIFLFFPYERSVNQLDYDARLKATKTTKYIASAAFPATTNKTRIDNNYPLKEVTREDIISKKDFCFSKFNKNKSNSNNELNNTTYLNTKNKSLIGKNKQLPKNIFSNPFKNRKSFKNSKNELFKNPIDTQLPYLLVFYPQRYFQAWRFLTYQFVHARFVN